MGQAVRVQRDQIPRACRERKKGRSEVFTLFTPFHFMADVGFWDVVSPPDSVVMRRKRRAPFETFLLFVAEPG
jgi:hypothetical protein